MLRRSIAASDGRKFLNGRPLEQLELLVATFGVDVVRDATLGVDEGQLRVPGFVAELGQMAAAIAAGYVDVDGDLAQEPDVDLVAMHDRVDNLRRLIATHEGLGDVDEVERLRMQLETCENVIRNNNGRIPT